MSKSNLELKSILDIPRWEIVQDQIAKATGTAIITIDYKGTPITKHSMRTDFCAVIRENPVTCKRCCKCDSLAGLEAVRLNRPFIYLCHCGIVDVAVPITVGDKYMGAVMFGQVRIANGSDSKVERLVNEISSFQPGSDHAAPNLRELYQRLPEMEYEQIRHIADMLNAIVQYTVEKAVLLRAEIMSYEWRLRSAPNGMQEFPSAPVEIQSLKGFDAAEEAKSGHILKSSLIYPAIVYIENHLNEMISMSGMAELCHLSKSYFSRLFQRDAGENFTSYVNRTKIEHAKALLRGSSASIEQIASLLGYIDSSYFVKLFKKYEGVTPLGYRQHKQQRY